MEENSRKTSETHLHGSRLLREESCDDIISLTILPFTKVGMSDIACLVYHIECWPVLVLIGRPRSESIIESNRIGYAIFRDFGSDIGYFLFIGELWSMDSDDDESSLSILLIECLEMRYSSLTVDTAKCPEIYYYDLASQTRECERC